jgi:transposase-like protein
MGAREPYPDEFKQEAVRLVREQGLAPSQVARDLGIDPETLRRGQRRAAGRSLPTRRPLGLSRR